MFVLSFSDGETGVTLGALYRYITVPCAMTIKFVSVSPSVDDASLTIDVNDDGTGVISTVDCSDTDVPGTWKSTAMGGSNAPVQVAAGSVLSLDANSATSGTRVLVHIYADEAAADWA